MPSSHPHQLNEIAELILAARPQSMLDVGAGFGKFGLLAREYLELWDGRQSIGGWKYRIDALEVCKDYILDHHRFIYDHIYLGDALEVLGTLDPRYDLLLASDILEHFDREKGEKFLAACRSRSRNTIISTPHDVGPQVTEWENPYETHRSEWSFSARSGAFPMTSYFPMPSSFPTTSH